MTCIVPVNLLFKPYNKVLAPLFAVFGNMKMKNILKAINDLHSARKFTVTAVSQCPPIPPTFRTMS